MTFAVAAFRVGGLSVFRFGNWSLLRVGNWSLLRIGGGVVKGGGLEFVGMGVRG